MKTMRIVWVLDVEKVENELSGPFAEVGAPQTDNESSNPHEIFHKNIFLVQFFYLNTLLSYRKLYI